MEKRREEEVKRIKSAFIVYCKHVLLLIKKNLNKVSNQQAAGSGGPQMVCEELNAAVHLLGT